MKFKNSDHNFVSHLYLQKRLTTQRPNLASLSCLSVFSFVTIHTVHICKTVQSFLNTVLAVLRYGRLGFDPWSGEDLLEKGMATHFSILA